MSKYIEVNEETGEFTPLVRLVNNPKQYRFNGQTGEFNLNGNKPILDKKGKKVTEFSLQPICFRFFYDDLFDREKEEFWAELFFLDDKKCISSIMFNGTSANELIRTTEIIGYEPKNEVDWYNLTEVILTIKPVEKTSKAANGKKYFMCQFSYDFAPEDETAALKELDELMKIHRKDTLTNNATFELFEGAYFADHVANLVGSKEETLELAA